MKIEILTFLNLNSLKGRHEVNFNQAPLNEGLFAITGPTGAGKTTLLDAITIALYGFVHRHEKDATESMTRFTAEAFSELTFSSNGKTYRAKWSVKRSRNQPNGTLQTPKMELVDAETGQLIVSHPLSAVQKKIVEVCGLDREQFLRSVMLSQGDFTRFLKARENERSELLEKITDTGIYSRISTFVFAKARQQKQELELQQAKMNNVVLLTDQQQDEIHENIVVARQKITAINTVKLQAEAKLKWLQLVQKLEADKEDQQKDLDKVLKLQADNAIMFAALERHRQAAKYQLPLQRLKDLLSRQQSLTDKITREEGAIPGLTEQMANLQQVHEELSAKHHALKQQLADSLPLFDQVIELDIQVANQQKLFNTAEGSLILAGKELSLINQRKKDKDQAAIANSKRLEATQNWLREHVAEKELERELVKFGLVIGEISVVQNQLQQLTRQHKNLLTHQATIKQKLQADNEEVKQLTHKLQAAGNRLNNTAEQFANRFSNISIEELDNTRKQLPGLIATCKNQRELAVAYADLRLQQQQLQKQLTELNDRVVQQRPLLQELASKKETAADHLNDLQKLLVLETKIQSYQQDRDELEPNQPCPLCGSVHHPFVEDYRTAYVTDAQKRYNEQKGVAEHLNREHTSLTIEIEKAEHTRQSLETEAGRLLKAVQHAVDSFYQNNELLPKPLDIEKPAVIDAVIKRKVEDQAIADKRITDYGNLEHAITLYEKEKHLLDQQLLQLSATVAAKKQSIENNAKELERLLTDIKERENKVADLIAQAETVTAIVNIEFVVANANDIKQTLQLRNAAYQLKVTEAVQLQNEEIQLNAELASLQESLKEKSMAMQQRQLDRDDQQQQLIQLKQQRQNLFGTSNPAEERQRLNEAISKLASKLQDNEKQHAAQQLVLDTLKNKVADYRSQQVALEEAHQRDSVALQQLLAENNIESISTLEAMLLPPAEEADITALHTRIEKDLVTKKGIVHNTALQLKQEKARNLTTDTIEELNEWIHHQQEEANTFQQHIGGLQQQLDINHRNTEHYKEIVDAVAKQQSEADRWEKLSNLIGSADGNKFSKFAQGLTLAQLTHLANRHLLKLSDRYQIIKTPEKDLELQIVDGYQADVVRPMSTLSGGESFLVSLALALGLSDLAGNKTQINSLFIDEGFGTLDADTLDTAITALENLQASGKAIGIISHVEALKERIGAQIEVAKQPGGYSKLIIKAYGKVYGNN